MTLPIVTLGKTGIKATELCFGTLTMSPIQAGLAPEDGGQVIRKAIEQGVTFIDTAQAYRVYAHVKAGISSANREDLVIATKTHAKTAEDMYAAFDQACEEMGVEYLDIFHLHLVSSVDDFKARQDALDTLKELKSKGLVKAIGVSAHAIEPFRHIRGNEDIDICFPAFNKKGFGINDGTVEEMAEVLKELHAEGKGIYAMKPLGGGHLSTEFEEALDFVRQPEFMDAVAIGMKDERELAVNIAYFRGEPITEQMKERAKGISRKLLINRMCRKCGKCVEVCEQGALRLGEEQSEPDLDKCIFCGYCAPACPVFAIRVV